VGRRNVSGEGDAVGEGKSGSIVRWAKRKNPNESFIREMLVREEE